MVAISPFRRPASRRDEGYILLTLLLFVALLVIGAAAIAPSLSFQVKRDREEELIHRGVQYSRAIRRYFKKFGHYPTKIEDLENTNNIRFLRKRYKDPITGKDFKLLHLGEVRLMTGPGIAGGTPVSAMGGLAGAAAQATATATAGAQGVGAAEKQTKKTAGSGSAGDAEDTDSASDSPGGFSSGGSGGSPQSLSSPSDPLTGKTFGGGPILGVASTSNDETVREFDDKNHYKDWQFIYDPSMDRGGLLTTPMQRNLKSFGQNQQVAPANGTSGFGGATTGPSNFGGAGQPMAQPQTAAPVQPQQQSPQQ